jgi:hypothetical protein
MDKNKLPRIKRPPASYQDADFALQHAVVRGEDQAVINELRKIRDSLL